MGQPRRSESALEDDRAAGRVVANPFGEARRLLARPQVGTQRGFCDGLWTGSHEALFLALAAKHARDRVMHPWIDLQVAIFRGGKAKFNRAVGADKGSLAQSPRILYRDPQEPLWCGPAA